MLDTVTATTIHTLMKSHSKPVQETLHVMLAEVVVAMGISSTPGLIKMMVEDVLEVYGHESLEDIYICLKNGRQGLYGTTYNKFNTVVFREWMTIHLEDKSRLRQYGSPVADDEKKAPWTKEEYEHATKVGRELNEAIEEKKNKLAGYDQYREGYFGKRVDDAKPSTKKKSRTVRKSKGSGRKK